MTTVLIIGGYGTFGRRLVRLLSNVEGLTLLVAGRNLDKAQSVITSLNGATNLIPRRVDRTKALSPQLNRPVHLVVDAVGPFQNYGKTRDLVLDFCIEQGAIYVDLSDDPTFCAHIIRRAKDAPIPVATAWSTYSAVTGAVVHALGGGVPRAGIVPNPHQPMGRAVIDSVLDYAGQPIAGGHGLTQIRQHTIAPPGALPLQALTFTNVATPDTVLIHPEATGWVATQPQGLQSLLVGISRLVRRGLFPRLNLFSGLIYAVQSFIKTGEARGGLFIETNGRRFDLIGDGDSGPDVPAIPAAALITAMHSGETFPPGLLCAGDAFPLERLTPWFDRQGVQYGIRDNHRSLYSQALSGSMAQLPNAIQDLHTGGTFEGKADVTRGRNPISRLIANLFRFPQAGPHNLTVSITTDAHGRERWARQYSGREMLSLQEQGRGRTKGMIIERFGPFAVHIGLVKEQEKLRYVTRGRTCLGCPLPRRLAPGGDIYESADDAGRFQFHVDIIAPIIGRLVKYEGWLVRC